MTDNLLRARTTPRRSGEDQLMDQRGLRDGSAVVVPWRQALAIEGRSYHMQMGTEDVPIDSTVTIDPILVSGVLDIPTGTIVMPFWGQVVIGTWQDGTVYNYMLEIDNAKNRYTSAGTAFTPLSLRTDAPITSLCSAYVGPDIVTAAKTTGGSLELYRESIEVNVGDAADYWPKMEYKPKKRALPMIVGPASIVIHFGATNTTDPTYYGSLSWFELLTADYIATS